MSILSYISTMLFVFVAGLWFGFTHRSGNDQATDEAERLRAELLQMEKQRDYWEKAARYE